MKPDFQDTQKGLGPEESTHHELPIEEGLIPTPLEGAGIDPIYEGKARVLNNAIQDIGMGRYQWQLFIVVGGFGWASDNLWPTITALILPAIKSEFKPSKAPLLSLSQNIGLLVGAMFWGFGCGDCCLHFLEQHADSAR